MSFPEVGDTLDIFTLCSELHKGPLATIFLAEDLLSRQRVVLKMPCGDILNQPILLYHYQNEDRISRLLDHPGIVRFIQRQRSRQYIIMEHVIGQDLRSRVGRNRTLRLGEALPLMDQLCSVIGYLHEQAIVHLDLKPENIICCRQTGIKLIDFGLASCRHLPDLLALDMKNPQGSPWYIAPEQLLGERADPRCDIYSMGMLLYEMLTGRLPWPRSSKVRISRRRLRHEPTPPRYYNKKIPAQIQSIILRAIARHAEDRYASVAEMQDDLTHWSRLPVTEAGCTSKAPALWRRLLPGKAVELKSGPRGSATFCRPKPQIIGAMIDSPESDSMLAEVKKQALIRHTDVTLVHVIEEENDSHFRRYGITVEGEKLMARLEEAVQLLRRCSIDPGIRLIRGEVAEVLAGLGTTMDIELLVLGKSRQKEGFLRSASVRRRLEENSPAPLIIAEKQQFSPVGGLAALRPEQLTADQVLSCDIFLVDLWYEHLHYLTDFIYGRLLHPGRNVVLLEDQCRFGQFLSSLQGSEIWQQVTTVLEPLHLQFHQIAATMGGLVDHDLAGLQALYSRELLPLACTLKKELGRVSLLLRAHLDVPPPSVPFLTDQGCPVTRRNLACYGPLLRALSLNQDLRTLIQAQGEKT